MKLMWMSNAPWASSGYGNQTKLFVPRIRDLGHDVSIFAFYGLEGAMLNWDGIQVYPKGHHTWGQDVGAAHTQHTGASVVLTLIDAWVMEPDMLQIHGVKWVPWFPIDHEPVPPPIVRRVEKAYRRIVFSKHAEREMHNVGLDCWYVPHGIDTNIFYPMDDRQDVKQKLGLADKFVVGTVAANKGTPSRKALPEQIEAFAEFHRRHPDTVFYMHCAEAKAGQNQGMNLPEIVEDCGLEAGVDVIFPDQYRLLMGFDDQYMRAIYNAMDVFLLPSMGEGFGIPIVEAQACGTPVIVGGWTAMDELGVAGWRIDKADAHHFRTPMGAYQYLPRIGAIVDMLEEAYKWAGAQKMRDVAHKFARKYDADKITKRYWKPALADLSEMVGMWAEADAWQK